MRIVLRIVLNDLRRKLRAPVAVILLMLIPVVITLIIGLVFGRSGETELPRIRVLLADEDGGIFGEFLRQGMRQDRFADMIDLVPVPLDEGRRMMERGKASALIVVPRGFTGNVLDQRPDTIEVVTNPAERFLPAIVEEIVVTTGLIFDGGARIFADQIAEVRSVLDGGRWPRPEEITRFLDGARNKVVLTRGYLADSLIAIDVRDAAPSGGAATGLNLFAFVMPGSLMIGLLFISEISMRDIFRERSAGTLQRLLATPAQAGHFIGGKIASTFALTAVACLILLVVSAVGFRIHLGRPLPLAIHFVGTILMCTGLVTLFYGFIRSERAADAVMSVLIIILALLGGSMVPYEAMGESMRRIAHLSPVFWASDGFKKIFLEDWGVRELGLHIAILYGLALCTIVAGTALLGRRMARGG